MMASLDVKFHGNRVEITSQAFCCDIHDTWENRKVWFVVLRALCCPESGKPLFSYQAIADAFGYNARQNINNFVREYEQCDENLFDYLRHKRKVDPVVVEAVREEVRRDVLLPSGELRIRVNHRLGRDDLTCANIRVALEQIPCSVIRGPMFREIAAGSFHPKEEVVLRALFTFFEHDDQRGKRGAGDSWCAGPLPAQAGDVACVNRDARAEKEPIRGVAGGQELSSEMTAPRGVSDKLVRYAEIVSAPKLEAIHEEPDESVIQKGQSETVSKLLTPNLAVSEIPESVVQMVKAMTLYFSGASFSRLGCWFGGKAKSTMYTWIIGLALALWPVIRGWLWRHVKGSRIYVDEKWLKIRKKWHYWFVAVEHDSGLPVFHDLLPTRSKWACRLFLLKLRRLGKIPSLISTDGLQGYVRAIATIFPAAKHLLCVFHHQQSVTRCVNKQFLETDQEAANAAKKQMKQVVQTSDTRTVKRRLNRLEHVAKEKRWTILNWITGTRDKLKHLIPATRSNTYPRTTNEIERFFRAFVRFYKTRCGFHSIKSAKRQITFFLVVYLFTIQAESGTAPIEKITPEAKTMPFYRLLNYPFASEMTSHSPHNVKPIEEMATESLKEAA
jgi:transposase-like protein